MLTEQIGIILIHFIHNLVIIHVIQSLTDDIINKRHKCIQVHLFYNLLSILSDERITVEGVSHLRMFDDFSVKISEHYSMKVSTTVRRVPIATEGSNHNKSSRSHTNETKEGGNITRKSVSVRSHFVL